jgi:hypothetical protein
MHAEAMHGVRINVRGLRGVHLVFSVEEWETTAAFAIDVVSTTAGMSFLRLTVESACNSGSGFVNAD